ncbi:hypothetical protein Q4519_15305 [Motilimonas sp. 1_MG-2023]|uniref:hypothetical protein n=1 Tax=Motilimonas sp. 1_MG-2023 TaxID=3062672 RepID=UPI0026E1F3CE|nr:hypothetical protein [Motilimonas sp. 1_MG-2023]MDO6527047.1 hypothetical protein [Motilimonas sp. 1_MG-2023]
MSHKSPLNDDAISKAYQQQSNDMPSSALDDKILAASRRAVAAKPTSIAPKRSWRNMPFLPAIAASFFVAAVFVAQQEEPEHIIPQAEVAPMSISAPALMKSAAPEMMAEADVTEPLQFQGKIEQRDQQWWLVTSEQDVLIEHPPRNIADFEHQQALVQGHAGTSEGEVISIVIQEIKLTRR